ncbi:unnamed protein product [Orchesella dallaii]|uniref:Uncharacterized protein n=1 Tax=Orchesella dallaii TaxID=48710 RepID=A0ABP1S158_9HEXA
MFLFSKKFLLLVAVPLLFGGERQLANALKCHVCLGPGPDAICDYSHFGESKDCSDHGACGMYNHGNNIISKYCEPDKLVWEDDEANDYKPRCSMTACYCITDNCNKPRNFGMPPGAPGGTGGDGAGGGGTGVGDCPTTNGAIGTRSITPVWMITVTVTVAMMAVGPLVVIVC